MRILRSLLRAAVLSVVVLFLAVAMGALVPGQVAENSYAQMPDHSGPESNRRILVLSNAIHTDIALPADPDVLEALGFVTENGLELDVPGVFWIVVGWGGRAFYVETPTWSDLKPLPVVKALTWDRSVMHVQRAGFIPEDHPGILPLDLEESAFSALLDAVVRSFDAGDAGMHVPLEGAAYGENDTFYPAEGAFNAVAGCNVWTARMLRTAGIPTGLWTPLPGLLTWSMAFHQTERAKN